MKDSFDREINYLRISVTDLCNLRCEYCMKLEGVEKLPHSKILSIEKIEEIVKEAAKIGIDKIRITGGEPLVRNGIEEIIRKVSKVEGIKEVSLTTNGVLLKDKIKILKECGLNRLNISLDTLKEDRYKKITRIGELKNVLDGIKCAQEVGYKNIKINTVLIKGFNDDEIDDFVTFAANNSLTVRFIELMPIGESIKLENECFLSNEYIGNRPDLIKIKDDGVSRLYRIKNSNGYIGLISPISHKFCSSCNRIRLTADGKIKPCLHSDLEIDVFSLEKDEIKEALIKAIKLKPKEHYLEKGYSDSKRDMNKIGG